MRRPDCYCPPTKVIEFGCVFFRRQIWIFQLDVAFSHFCLESDCLYSGLTFVCFVLFFHPPELTTLPRIFIRVVCRFNSVTFATQRQLAHPSDYTM